MATYIVSYDLRKGKDYASLIDAIKTYTKWGKALESLWIIVTTKSAAEVRDFLQSKIDADDGLIVIKSWREAARFWVLCDNERLKSNL